MNKINLTVRFLLELVALFVSGLWGWNQADDWTKYLLAFGLPIMLAIVWGIFNVPNDPSRSGKAPVVVPGFVRLILELLVFGFATWALYDLGYSILALLYGSIVFVHYVASYDRVRWLLS